jgi:hypothetical protein
MKEVHVIDLLKSVLPFWLVQILQKIRGIKNGKWPLKRAEGTLAASANLDRLTGKIRFKMAFDRSDKLTTFADKLSVRDYVAEKVGEKYLSNLIATIYSGQELLELDLPGEFALKSNHGSGAMVLVSEIAPIGSRLPNRFKKRDWEKYLIQPEAFNKVQASKLVDLWMGQNYFYRDGQFPEWAYKDIKPAVIIEELMYDNSGNLPADFKFFMINGTCEFIQMDSSRYEAHTRNLFTPTWELIPGINIFPNNPQPISRPQNLEEMIRVSEALAAAVDFVRVDLYETSHGIKFGELTNYPGGGVEEYQPDELGKTLGARWQPSYLNSR